MIDPQIDGDMATILGWCVEFLDRHKGGFAAGSATMMNTISDFVENALAKNDQTQCCISNLAMAGLMCAIAEAKRRGLEIPVMSSRVVEGKAK